MSTPNPNKKTSSTNKPVLAGCLIALALFFVVCGVGAYYVWRSLAPMVGQVTAELEKEMAAEEDKLRKTPAAEVQALSYTELLAAFKADRSGALAKYKGKVLALEGFVSKSPTLAESVPIKLPIDFIIIQPTAGQVTQQQELIPCLYSSAQKARVAQLKPLDPIKVRGELKQDKDGDLSLVPCVVSD